MSIPPQLDGFSPVQQISRLQKNPRSQNQQKPVQIIEINGENNVNKPTYIKYKKDNRFRSGKKVQPNAEVKHIKMFSTNAAGLVNGKVQSLNNEVKATSSNIVTKQETHSIKMPDCFVIFESIRKAKHGGTLCAVQENMNPRLIEEYSDPIKLLVD